MKYLFSIDDFDLYREYSVALSLAKNFPDVYPQEKILYKNLLDLAIFMCGPEITEVDFCMHTNGLTYMIDFSQYPKNKYSTIIRNIGV